MSLKVSLYDTMTTERHSSLNSVCVNFPILCTLCLELCTFSITTNFEVLFMIKQILPLINLISTIGFISRTVYWYSLFGVGRG